MKQYAGLDVSLKEVTICVVDEEGATVARGRVPTEPAAIVRFLAEKTKGLAGHAGPTRSEPASMC